MNTVKANNLACPIDGEKLLQHDKQLVCENGHSFDIAKQGYVNLLPVQHKRSKQPGDSKAMVLARTQFLDSGIYQAIADRLSDIVGKLISEDGDACLLDAGCGEGYYFNAVFSMLNNLQGTARLSFIGLDISKNAILQATKRNKKISWVVGTNRKPPVEEKSVDIILCLFGFLSAEGFSKILKPGGKIILVDPGDRHLKELREVIYPELKKADKLDLPDKQITGFSIVSSESLQFKKKITNKQQINDLLLMTPHFYRASKDGREAASLLSELAVTIDVVFRVLEKTSDGIIDNTA